MIEKEMKAGHYKNARKVVNKQGLRWESIERIVTAYDAIQAQKKAAKGKPHPAPSPTPTHRVVLP
jgi:hypothetical protein